MNIISEIKEIKKNFSSKILFDENLSKYSWFNLGGPAKIVFKPKNLNELSSFLKKTNGSAKIKVLGAGSNILVRDGGFNGIIIKLDKTFSHVSLFDKKTIIAGSSTLDKNLSIFALENSLSGFEFLSCIPGTIGGGIRMNSGCFGSEFKDILLSVQAIDRTGRVLTIPSSKIKFEYRTINLSRDLIFLSASFKGKFKKKDMIKKEIEYLKSKKEKAQPTRIKTSGSTFKNPIKQTNKKVWELIKSSVPQDMAFGDATISEKHNNFFVNKKNATFKDMKKLIDHVKKNVKEKTGVSLDLEIEIVG